MISLPRLLLVTDSALMQPDFGLALEAALLGGARLIQLRESGPPTPDNFAARAARCDTARQLCDRYGARLLLNGDETAARRARADGVHWPARLIPSEPAPPTREIDRTPSQARPMRAETVWGDGFLRGASVHCVAEAQRAHFAGADFLIFGSVWATASHPGAPPAGIDALAALCRATPLPVFAVGGVEAPLVAQCRAAGTWGVAVIRAVWQAPDIEAAARALCVAADAQ